MDSVKTKMTSKEKLLEEQLLKKLTEYGDSVLEGPSSDKRKKKLRKSATDNTSAENTAVPLQNKKKKKKKKKKNGQPESENTEEHGDSEGDIDDKLTGVSGKERQLELMKMQLGLTSFKSDLEKKKRKEEEEKAKLKSSKCKKEPEVVVFQSRKPKNPKSAAASDDTGDNRDDNPEFDLKQARFDVRKFGIKGFKGDQKEEAMTALLMRLGAKPPKNKYVNYKDFQEQKKAEIQQQKEKNEQLRREGYKIPTKGKDRKRRRDKNDVGFVDGQVGVYKGGVQIVNKDMIGGKTAKIKK